MKNSSMEQKTWQVTVAGHKISHMHSFQTAIPQPKQKFHIKKQKNTQPPPHQKPQRKNPQTNILTNTHTLQFSESTWNVWQTVWVVHHYQPAYHRQTDQLFSQ